MAEPEPILQFEDFSDFATTDEEALRRFEIAKSSDPFPEIEPSLLNSADIHDYARITGMLHPFHPEQLKSASYEAAIWGQCICWDREGKRQQIRLEKDSDQFTLEANSIAFVQVEPLFRLPDYIALRFNLKITHVHRGILLGTGPLVDPGFEGRLLIPLHNLTLNPYTFSHGEGLIWVEFTKTSLLPNALKDENKNTYGLSKRGQYKGFRSDKKYLAPAHYLHKASPHSPIRSSIPSALLESRDQAISARKTAQTISAIGLLGLLALGVTTWSLIQDTWRVADDVRHQLLQEVGSQNEQSIKVDQFQKQLQLLDNGVTDKFSKLHGELETVRDGLSKMHTSSPTVKQKKTKASTEKNEDH